MRFKIDWASLIVGSKFAIFALFYFVFNVTDGFLRWRFGGHIFGGAKTWRGLISEFYGMRFKISSFSCGPTDTAIHACKTS